MFRCFESEVTANVAMAACSFLRDAVTNYHKFSGFKQQENLFCYSSGGQNFKISLWSYGPGVGRAARPLEAPGQIPLAVSSFWWMPASLVLWPPNSNLYLRGHVAFSCSVWMCHQTPLCLSHEDECDCVWGLPGLLRITSPSQDLYFNHICKDLSLSLLPSLSLHIR